MTVYVYIENRMESTKRPLELINKRYKFNYISVTAMNNWNRLLKIPFTLVYTNIKHLGINLQI